MLALYRPATALRFGLRFAVLDRFLEELFHLLCRLACEFFLLAAKLFLLFAQFALLFSQGAHFFPDFGLLIPGEGLNVANPAL